MDYELKTTQNHIELCREAALTHLKVILAAQRVVAMRNQPELQRHIDELSAALEADQKAVAAAVAAEPGRGKPC